MNDDGEEVGRFRPKDIRRLDFRRGIALVIGDAEFSANCDKTASQG